MAICCRRKKFKVADATYEIKSIKKQKKNKFSRASFQGMNFSKKTSKATKPVRFEFEIIFYKTFLCYQAFCNRAYSPIKLIE